MIYKFTSTNAGKWLHNVIMNCRSRNITPARPMYLHIETSSICNAKCVMCAHSQMKRPKQIMNDDLFEKIVVGTYNTGIKWVNLQFFGEPLMDKNIFQRIIRLKEEGFKVKFNTNASLLNEENCVSLFNTKIDQVDISFDAFNRNSYNKVRKGLDYDKTLRNINLLFQIRNKKRAKTRIFMTFVRLEANEHEVIAFHNKWKGLADKIIISYASNWAGRLKVDGKKPVLFANNNICKLLWKDLIILQDGKVALCCQDYEGLGNMGNLNYQSLDEVWNGDKFVLYRKFHREGRRKELEICNNCKYYSFWWIL